MFFSTFCVNSADSLKKFYLLFLPQGINCLENTGIFSGILNFYSKTESLLLPWNSDLLPPISARSGSNFSCTEQLISPGEKVEFAKLRNRRFSHALRIT